MKRIFTSFLMLTSVITMAQKRPSKIEWIKLFNGKDLKEWQVKIKDHALNENYGNTFRVENGLLKVSYDQYDDFNEQ